MFEYDFSEWSQRKNFMYFVILCGSDNKGIEQSYNYGLNGTSK